MNNATRRNRLLAAYNALPRFMKIIARTIATFIVFLFIWTAGNIIPWHKVGVAEWAYWIQAVGSVGTLGAAIYIASTESRERKIQANVVARLTYAGMIFRLHNIELAARKASEKLTEKVDPERRINYRSIVQLFEQAGTWSSDELIALVPLEHDVALYLSTAGDRIRHCKDLLGRADRNPKLSTLEAESQFNKEMGEILGHAHSLIVEASRRGRILTNTFQVITRKGDEPTVQKATH